jgi:hypothetical protein
MSCQFNQLKQSDARFAEAFQKFDDCGAGCSMHDISNVLLKLQVTPTKPILMTLMSLVPLEEEHVPFHEFRSWFRKEIMHDNAGLNENPVVLRNRARFAPVGRQKPAHVKLPPGRHPYGMHSLTGEAAADIIRGGAVVDDRGKKAARATEYPRREHKWCSADTVSTLLHTADGTAATTSGCNSFDPITKAFCVPGAAPSLTLSIMLRRLRRLVLTNWEKKVGGDGGGSFCSPEAQ